MDIFVDNTGSHILTPGFRLMAFTLTIFLIILLIANLSQPQPQKETVDYSRIGVLPLIEVTEEEKEKLEAMRRHYIHNRKMYEYLRENPPEPPPDGPVDYPEDMLF